MFYKNLFNKSGDQLAKEAIDDYNKGKDEFAVIEKLQKALKTGIKQYPLDLIYLHIGSCYFDLSIYEKAIEELEKGYKINPNNYRIISNLGSSYQQLKMPEKALQFFLEALKINPNHSFAYNNIGLYYYELCKHFEALEYLDKAIKINPNLAVAHAIKARCLSYIGDKEEALKYLKSAQQCGYDNCDNLRKDIDYIYDSHPKLFWDEKKFVELAALLSNSEMDLLNKIKRAKKEPYIFFKENETLLTNKYLTTAFEITNVIPFSLLLDYLNSMDLLVIVNQDSGLHDLIGNMEQLARKFVDVDDNFFNEFYKENGLDEAIDLIVSISCKIKLTFGLEIIDIWYNNFQLLLTAIKTDDWGKLNYPFSETEAGFGRVRCLATEDAIKNFLTNG